MLKREIERKENILEKLNYLGLDLENIPNQLKYFEPLEFRIPKFYDEKQYKQYRYLPIDDIQILLSPTHRLDEIEEKYKKARPLSDYLDSKNEENILRYTTFLNMLKHLKIKDVEKIRMEQENLNQKIPFKVKFEGNYLWQIYYSEHTNKYFMIVPTEDIDYSTFFFLLKEKLEKTKTEKIFVPIRNAGYSNKYFTKSEFEDIENYLWLFTKDWPMIYEVYDKKNNASIRIVGETEVYGKIKSQYRIKIENKVEANKFYKLLKAMFILQTELPHYFEFKTNINKKGGIDFYYNDRNIVYEDISEWIKEEYDVALERIKEVEVISEKNKEKLGKLKLEVSSQEIEYLAKEKQISTFLECKKSFLGKFKYYFKYSKRSNNNKLPKHLKDEEISQESNYDSSFNELKNIKEERIEKLQKSNYTLEELVTIYKQFEILENELKNLIMDINALKLKRKNMQKKIENATNFIEEIDNHKKSIFEFWKYSNKDEMEALPEGEEEEINIIKKITKVFDYEEDLDEFGKNMDKIQRKNLSKNEKDSVYITTTNLLNLLNKVKNNEVIPREIDISLRELRKEANKEKELVDDEFDIFGGIAQDSTKISEIKNQKHRELPKDKFSILDISKTTRAIGYKLALEKITENIKTALSKITIPEDIPVYIATNDEKLNRKDINIFDINPEKAIKKAIKGEKNRINFYKINLKTGTNAVSYTNCIFYDNQNKTLPIGQDLSTNILVDISKLKLKLKKKTSFKILNYENEKNDFSKITLKSVNVLEYDLNEEEKTNK